MQKIKTTLVCSVCNEENNLKGLFQSILIQTKKPDEVIFIEDSSTDNTFELLRAYKKNKKNIKIFRVKNKNISKNRNMGIKKSKNEIIICIDAGCTLSKNYIQNISKPFENENICYVGGISKLLPKDLFDKCYASFIIKKNFSKDYLPKGHAMAFRKSLWKKIGGFSESLALGAEDTYFGKMAIKEGFNPQIVKNAIVYWENRKDLKTIFKKFNNYGFWDGKAFTFKDLPKNSKLSFIIAIIFPLAIIHSIWKGVILAIQFKKIKAFFYGVTIDFFKIYGYVLGLIRGKIT